jgi:uncharacterized membrane protein YqjE
MVDGVSKYYGMVKTKRLLIGINFSNEKQELVELLAFAHLIVDPMAAFNLIVPWKKVKNGGK